MVRRSTVRALLFLSLVVLIVPTVSAQQVGSISGRVTATDGSALPGVTVEARSNVLPQPRVTTSGANGEYRLPALAPGRYTLTFSLSGMQSLTRTAEAYLNQDTSVNVALGVEGLAETITVTADSPLINPTSTAIRSEVPGDVIEQVPVGQEYRDLLKLAPAVQLNDAAVRGPSAGGSEQDNVYHFDGVNVTLPLFGTLAAEPSSHDIAQVSIIKGGAKAVDFNRSAGLTIDSVSKSGTNEWKGEVQYQFQGDGMVADLETGSLSIYDEEKTWGSANLGGPILRDRLFLYGSYYRPTRSRANSSNVYGEVPDFDSERNEYFGKLTFTPLSNLLLSASYRDSDRENVAASVGGTEAATVSLGETSKQQIGIFEGSWVINDRSFLSAKYTDYGLKTSSRPDNLFSVVPSAAIGAQLDINNLDQVGYFTVPVPRTGTTPSDVAFNAFVAPIIERYGFIRNGVRTGGGAVGGALQINDQDFFREGAQLGYDITLGSTLTHDLHFGYQQEKNIEDLARFSNGWGSIIVQGGRVNCPAAVTSCAGQPVFFQSEFQRNVQGEVGRQVITSEFQSNNFEINDTIKWNNWAFNVGVLVSNDTLYGQGLREDDSAESGYVLSPGTRYQMYEIPWEKQIQPRLGATWAYNGHDTLYASYAKYNPAGNSLARAAAWDRNTLGLVVRAYFDANGRLIGSEQVASSSGKLYVDDLDPRYTDEYMVGTARQLTSNWTGRLYARHRYSTNFWEDTNNNARADFRAPEGISRDPYIPNLNDLRRQICSSNKTVCTGTLSGSSYVIAELDGAFTKYYEATFESDYRRGNVFLRGSYTWSHYYGNFDQDNTSTTYDFATFIGSSNIADGGGRQLWDNKYGDLHGDRRHLLKAYGYYTLPWNATVGAFTLYQSGHPWEIWSYEPYGRDGQNIIGTSTSDTNRYAEPAGSRRTEGHYQVDLNYTQNFDLAGLRLQFIGDAYNLTDNQTGYSPQPAVHLAAFGQPRLRHSPRRYNVALRLQF
jgi:hypothetical protein